MPYYIEFDINAEDQIDQLIEGISHIGEQLTRLNDNLEKIFLEQLKAKQEST